MAKFTSAQASMVVVVDWYFMVRDSGMAQVFDKKMLHHMTLAYIRGALRTAHHLEDLQFTDALEVFYQRLIKLTDDSAFDICEGVCILVDRRPHPSPETLQ